MASHSMLPTRNGKFIEQCQSAQTLSALSIYHICQMQLACIEQDFDRGITNTLAVQPILNSVLGFTTFASYYFYSSLILLNNATGSTTEMSDNWQQVQSNQAKLKIWSVNCPENFLNKYLLVQAEICRIQGNTLEAIDLYDQAIACAKTNSYIQEEALANELAAKFYLNWHKEKIASDYMQEAYYCYSRWGAKAKNARPRKPLPQFTAPNSPASSTSPESPPNHSDDRRP